MSYKQVVVGGTAQLLPVGKTKSVKLMNPGTEPVFLVFGDHTAIANDQGNRCDTGESEFEVPDKATHVSLFARQQFSVLVDAGEPPEEKDKPKQKPEPEEENEKPAARKK